MIPANWFFDTWNALGRILLVGALAYLSVVFLLRLSGNRTLAKTAAFDQVVTVAFGSALATTLLSKETTLAGGVAAFAGLILFQFVLAFSVSRLPMLQRLVVHGPIIVLHRGELRPEAMRRARLVESDVHAALRQSGLGRVDAAELVVLESDGTFSVVPRSENGPADVLEGIRDQLD